MSLKISRILHAGYVLESPQNRILFDPIFENPFSRNCYAFPKVTFDSDQISKLSIDAIFISHFHDDHCSLESLNLLNRNTTIYLFCLYPELFDWIRQLGFLNVIEIKLNEPIVVGDFEVIARRALDEDIDSIFHIKYKSLNILNVVDSWIDPETFNLLLQTKCWDLVLWPFQTMRELEVISPRQFPQAPAEIPEESLEQLQQLNPKFLIPSSCQFIHENWSWYNNVFFPISYKFFQETLKSILPGTQVHRLDPSITAAVNSQTFEIEGRLSWVQLLEEKSVDYNFNPETLIPSTASIAKHFPAASSLQIEKAINFCKEEIFHRYSELEVSSESYFHKPRIWKLIIYNQDESFLEFYYEVQGHQLKAVQPDYGPIAWLTELPLVKLVSAIETGESLTSMYVRINCGQFLAEIENGLAGVDVLEDPLVRCLFNLEFGAYQKQQLQKIKGLK